MSPGTEFLHAYTATTEAHRLQRRADIATNFRLATAIPVGLAIGATEPNWPVTVLDTVAWLTDASDGHDAGRARELAPGLPRTAASFRDPLADKLKYYSGLGGIMARAIRQEDPITGVVVGANMVVSAVRDKAIAHDRQLASAYRKFGVSGDAIGINKRKTQIQGVSSVVLASPLSRSPVVRRVALAGLSAGTILGVFGQRKFRRTIHQQIADLG